MERGKRQPSLGTIFLLAAGLDIEPERLVREVRRLRPKQARMIAAARIAGDGSRAPWRNCGHRANGKSVISFADRPDAGTTLAMSHNAAPSMPLTFDLPKSVKARVETQRKRLGVRTASEVVRLALLSFDFEGYVPKHDPHGQISVRIPRELRARLKRAARSKRASIGELIRAAIEAQAAASPRKSAAGRTR